MATSGTTGVIEPKDVPLDYTVLKNPELLETPTIKVLPKQDPERTMRAVEFHSKKDMEVVERPMPMLTDPADVVLKVSTTCHLWLRPSHVRGVHARHEERGRCGARVYGNRGGCRSRSEELEEG